ncbi:hypothetical protein G5V59_13145 [Nocardioides sp. W3-2-3]|uniref:hypothetical protein n=1 Tax=Nocardioides convexus TaxID=2712224 RepID=UPI0024189024|nr:hypothetical protein [Nocardioides convexus]NHA00651.1 hypothetical protein [Nocardioides convexus]
MAGTDEPAWKRKQRLAEIFGDVEPSVTEDDKDEPAAKAEPAAEKWLKEQVPPHHGG